MRFNAIWAYLALSLVSAVYAAPLSEADAGITTLARSDLSSVSHARRDGGEYVATLTLTKSGGGRGRGPVRRPKAKAATPSDIARVKALIIRAAKEKWDQNIDPSEIRIVGNQYTSNTNAVPFTLEAPGLKECDPIPCKGEALYHVSNSKNEPELGAGKIFSQGYPSEIIYDSANENRRRPMHAFVEGFQYGQATATQEQGFQASLLETEIKKFSKPRAKLAKAVSKIRIALRILYVPPAEVDGPQRPYPPHRTSIPDAKKPDQFERSTAENIPSEFSERVDATAAGYLGTEFSRSGKMSAKASRAQARARTLYAHQGITRMENPRSAGRYWGKQAMQRVDDPSRTRQSDSETRKIRSLCQAPELGSRVSERVSVVIPIQPVVEQRASGRRRPRRWEGSNLVPLFVLLRHVVESSGVEVGRFVGPGHRTRYASPPTKGDLGASHIGSKIWGELAMGICTERERAKRRCTQNSGRVSERSHRNWVHKNEELKVSVLTKCALTDMSEVDVRGGPIAQLGEPS
ncbi:hypothetical protein F5877DRAFT_72326 [Lentinula edodes]|nr:hypothetical protein F5877DRAFT_72326 [Lentinula edodes]